MQHGCVPGSTYALAAVSFIMGRSDLSDGSAKLVGFQNALNNIRTKLKHSHVDAYIFFLAGSFLLGLRLA